MVDGSLTFAPAGMKARSVRIWISPGAAAVRDGPLVLYWHAAGSQPAEAVESLSQPVIDAVTGAGGVVAALYSDPDAGTLPWFLSDEGPSGRDDDLRVADEVVGCAALKPGLDLRHLHTLGLGAGAAQAAQMSYRRSGYVASAAVYSGGFDERRGLPANQAPANRFPALIFHGPASEDSAPEPRRARAAYTYWSDLTAHRHFAAVCLHSGGENVPSGAPQLVWDFFRQHPYGQDPSPWADRLPETFPGSCTLVPEAGPPKPAPVSLRAGQKRWDLEALRRVRG